MRRLSVIIPNHNYGRFIADAVESALAIDWSDIEVIVVDDGSTDNSLEVLTRFEHRVTVIAQENAGPRVACNRGFAASHGDAVIFLDSDDVLESSIAREAAQVWRPGISKVQVQMRRIDRNGRFVGRAFPNYRSVPTPEQIRGWMTRTAAYPTPPGSGNVYSRSFLERIFPVDDRCGDAADSACLAAAPFLGDVVTIPKSLVRYRMHGENRSSLLADPRRLTQQLCRAYQRQRFAHEVAGKNAVSEAELVRSLRRGRHLLQMRVAEHRLCPGAPALPTDSLWRMATDSALNVFAPGPESVGHRAAVAAWCLAVLTVPPSVARQLVRWRFR